MGTFLTFDKQTGLFETTVKNLRPLFGSPKLLADYLSKSLFFISIGNADISTGYDLLDNTTKQRTPFPKFSQTIFQKFSDNIKRLYGMGERNMQSFRLAINYNGRWDDLDYVDGELIGEWVENKLSYNELVEMTYRLTEIDRNMYDIILYGVIKLRSRWKKYRVKRDNDIDFIFRDDSSIKEIYIDKEKRVGGGTIAGGDTHVHKLPPSFFRHTRVLKERLCSD
ncbi:hypothetical protein Ddye_024744 [Dipteronia dyeriana]|uniref:Uncharacterized protein n=1 Tax=Dipteronia dyeriana TaxID=168575 RepID=A0AAD9TVZ9_9ROSI|nr:hypothetical protein Ddye_024744 [Dipteronia dyeriana]